MSCPSIVDAQSDCILEAVIKEYTLGLSGVVVGRERSDNNTFELSVRGTKTTVARACTRGHDSHAKDRVPIIFYLPMTNDHIRKLIIHRHEYRTRSYNYLKKNKKTANLMIHPGYRSRLSSGSPALYRTGLVVETFRRESLIFFFSCFYSVRIISPLCQIHRGRRTDKRTVGGWGGLNY